MPRMSQRKRKKILSDLDQLEYKILLARIENLRSRLEESEDEYSDEESDEVMVITPPVLSPLSCPISNRRASLTQLSRLTLTRRKIRYCKLLSAVGALRDEVEKSRTLNRLIPQLRAPPKLLQHFADFRPHLFRKKFRVDPEVFDCILNQISDHNVFHSEGNHPQPPVAIQLAIFLNRAGHYGNTITAEDVAQWAGHDVSVFIPSGDSVDAELARTFVEAKSCKGWSKGIFAADGSTFNLFEKPSFYGDTFLDRRGRYSVNCQLVVMPHNLLVVDYCLGSPGSVHDAYVFQETRLARDPEVMPHGHWIWADNAYPTKPWCVVPFKGMQTAPLLRPQKLFNDHLSKVRVCVEHAFAALKGRFQSLRELRLHIRSSDDMKYATFWIQCCIILHNMIIRFEESLGKESSVGWAGAEVSEATCEVDPVMVAVPAGTPGQQFRVELMRTLLGALGRDEYVVNEGDDKS